jgi:hypothetical protein
MRTLLTLTLMSAAIPYAAAQPDYFPLHVGNQWIYRQAGRIGGEPVVVDIPRTEAVNDQTYHVVRGLDHRDLYLRMAEGGVLYAYDPENRQEGVWAAFATPEGESYRTVVNECSNTARVVSRNARVAVPIGDLTGALAIIYPAGNCADAGLGTDYFMPYVGLVERESITIAGPRFLRLAYARIGGVTVLSEPEIAFSLTLDKPQYGGDDVPVLTARLTLRSTRSEPVTLTFPSGQRFDLVIRNESGQEVFTWSVGRAFVLAFGTERFGPGERNWMVMAPLSAAGERLPAGRYTAEAWLTTVSPRTYVASVGFEILPR